MSMFLIKGSYSYNVQKTVKANSKEEAQAMFESWNLDPMCEWESQDQDTYREDLNLIEEGVSLLNFLKFLKVGKYENNNTTNRTITIKRSWRV